MPLKIQIYTNRKEEAESKNIDLNLRQIYILNEQVAR